MLGKILGAIAGKKIGWALKKLYDRRHADNTPQAPSVSPVV